jgi:prophage regulatory protein
MSKPLSPQAPSTNEEVLRKPQIRKIVKASDATIWRWEKAGKFPKRIKIGPNSVGWLKSEIDEWLQNLAEAR